jgi:hypothetical protein
MFFVNRKDQSRGPKVVEQLFEIHKEFVTLLGYCRLADLSLKWHENEAQRLHIVAALKVEQR